MISPIRLHLVEVGPLEHPVAVDVRVDELAHAAALHPVDHVLGPHLRRLRPAGHRHAPAAHVDRHEHARRPARDARVEELDVGVGGGAEDHPVGAGGERARARRRRRAGRRRTAPAPSARCVIRSQVLEVLRACPRARRRGRPRAGSARPAPPTRARPRAGRRCRRSPGRSRPAAAARPCRRGCRWPAGGSRREAHEVAQQREPVGPGLLRVELHAEDVPAADDARELGAVGRPCRARPRRSRGRGANECTW